MKIFLSKFHWYNSDNIRVAGFIREGDRYLKNSDLADYFAGTDTIEKFEKKLVNANGQFSVIIESTGGIWAASDRLRNYPLFYTHINGELFISDDCYLLTEKLPEKRLNQLAVDCFLSAGYVVNNLTLIEGVFQIEAGEYIHGNQSVARRYYYDFTSLPVRKNNLLIATNELLNIFTSVFEKHFKALNDKFIVIPLSGGYDSRLVAVMCKKYHPDNVLCYTYGTENNCEVAPAREVASRLGFKWINIIYDSDLIDGYLEEDVFKRYYPYVSGLSSMFFMQEYFAVKYLKENSLVPENSVFMPGFCGDMLAGKYLFSKLQKDLSRNEIAKVVYKEFFNLKENDKKSESEIIKLISEEISEYNSESWRFFESWDQKQRHAKFIVNSAKGYLFFGYDYSFPLWDNLLEDFFFTLPFDLRVNKKLYDIVLRDFVFKEYSLNFQNEINASPLKKSIQRVKDRVKKYVPAVIKEYFIKSGSPIYYDQITKYMIEDLGPGKVFKPKQSNYYNSYITQWYLEKTRELLQQ